MLIKKVVKKVDINLKSNIILFIITLLFPILRLTIYWIKYIGTISNQNFLGK